jgi:4'-phosphopantetheinyl transferase
MLSRVIAHPPPQTIEIWFRLTSGLTGAAQDADLALLCDRERERHRRLRMPLDRREYAAAHALLRLALSASAAVEPGDWRFHTTPSGKPVLAARHAGLSFSLSHCRGLVACAIACGTDVGVDVEPIDRTVDAREIAARYFSAGEAAQIAARPADDQAVLRFVELWTLKEAHAKGTGLGLSHGLDTTTFDLDTPGVVTVTRSAEPWAYALFAPAPGYRLAVTARGGTPSPRFVVRNAEGRQDPTIVPLRLSRT